MTDFRDIEGEVALCAIVAAKKLTRISFGRSCAPHQRDGSGVLAFLPEHVAAAGSLVDPAREDEQQVGKPVQVLP
jgi:hypothetical protein